MRRDIKIAHEAPISIFDKVGEDTDYDYCLAHLYLENKDYKNKFLEAKERGRFIILDTSVFELGHPIDTDLYVSIIKELRPDVYILPDVLENRQKTVKNAEEWMNTIYKEIPPECQPMGVLQGKTYREVRLCYMQLNNLCLKYIAISFDYSFYESDYPFPNKLVSWMLGRVSLLGRLLRDGVINRNVRHHLLGVALPQEGLYYKNNRKMDWIYSVDTSNPVLHGAVGISYDMDGLWEKNPTKLFTIIDDELSQESRRKVRDNIFEFRRLWRRYQ